MSGIALSVDASCSGMGALQACLLPAAFLHALPGSPRWSPVSLLALVIALAWLTNLTRVLVISTVALTLGIGAAKGFLHATIGLLVLVIPVLVLGSLLGPGANAALRPAKIS